MQWGHRFPARAFLFKAPAKPKPCSSPKRKATTQGTRSDNRLSLSFFFHNFDRKGNNRQRNDRLDWTLGQAEESQCSADKCYRMGDVKAVTAIAIVRNPVSSKTSATTNNRWS